MKGGAWWLAERAFPCPVFHHGKKENLSRLFAGSMYQVLYGIRTLPILPWTSPHPVSGYTLTEQVADARCSYGSGEQ